MWVGQGALERVIVLTKRGGKGEEISFEDVDAARIVLLQRLDARDNMQRGLSFRPGFREYEGAVDEVEREEPDFSWNFRATLPPAQPAGDHQMQDEKEVALQLEDDPLAQTIQRDNCFSVRSRQWRIDRAQEKRRGQPDAFDSMPDDARGKRVQVEQDVGKLRHSLSDYLRAYGGQGAARIQSAA